MNNPTTQPNISASASQLPVQYTLRPGYYAGLIEKFVRESALSGNVIRGQRALAIGIITDINRILPKNTEKIQIIDRILDLVATIKSTKTDMRSQELLTAFVETLQTQKLQYTLHDADMIENLATTIETYLGFQYVDAERSLILRATPQVTSRNILAYLPRNMQVEILEPGSIWTKVRAGRKD